jgi:hypothetical protein
MIIARRKIESTRGRASALTLALALGSLWVAGDAAAQLKPGPTAGNTVYLDKARGYAFCEFEVVMGKPPNLTVQVYNTSGTVPCPPGTLETIDAKALAAKVGADAVIKNPTRWWLMDGMWLYGAGETYDFAGVKATWMAALKLDAGQMKEGGKPFATYKPTVVARNSKMLWNKGSQVYLLRDPDGKAWIMQAYTNLVDKTLSAADLPNLGSKLKPPPGWKYEVKTLDKDFTYIPPASTGHLTHAVSDDLQNVYQGCGFDTACNYMP